MKRLGLMSQEKLIVLSFSLPELDREARDYASCEENDCSLLTLGRKVFSLANLLRGTADLVMKQE